MIIIIDAYNVLKQALQAQHISEIDRLRFIKQVGLYGKAKGHTMLVVFDGGPHQRPNQDRIHGISVVYSGTQETADEYIQNYLQKHRALDLMVVSSDRQICLWAAARNIPSLEALDFYRLLHMSLKSQKEASLQSMARQTVKTTQATAEEVDRLMHETLLEYKEEEEGEPQERTSRAHHPTKQERQIIKKIKKL
jgi:predicted RNA-binding protein with PIN domain